MGSTVIDWNHDDLFIVFIGTAEIICKKRIASGIGYHQQAGKTKSVGVQSPILPREDFIRQRIIQFMVITLQVDRIIYRSKGDGELVCSIRTPHMKQS